MVKLSPNPLQGGAQLPQQEAQSGPPPDDLAAQYGKMSTAAKSIDQLFQGLEVLKKLGDQVTVDDVLEEGGKLVAAGFSPSAMAAALADLPDSGTGIASWILQHEQMLLQQKAQFAQQHELVRHQLATQKLQELVQQHGQAAMPQGALGGAEAPPNPLMGRA